MRLRQTFLSMTLFLVLSLGAPLQTAGSQVPTPEPYQLVALHLQNPADAAQIRQAGLNLYGRVYTAAGEILLVRADSGQRADLERRGLHTEIIDPAVDAAPGYFLVYALQVGGLRSLQAGPPPGVELLAVFDAHQGLVRAAPRAAEALTSLGIELQALLPHALPAEAPGPDLPESIIPHPQVQAMLDQVSSSTLTELVSELSGETAAVIGGSPYTITTRYSLTTTPIEKATQYAYEHLDALGLSTSYHDYVLEGSYIRRNVIGEQTGLTQPARIFLLTAHIDSYASGDPYNLAPGADDNASGSAGVLAAAEILSQYDFGCTIRYALFTGEEQGLYGSYAYAQDVAAAGENIEAVLNLDMIAYDSYAQPTIDLYTRPGNSSDLEIANLLTNVVSAYNLGLAPDIIQSGLDRSDHASFWKFGYPAILAIEDFDDLTPAYHTIYDTLDTLNMPYFTDYVRAAVGTLAHMGCGMGALAGTVLDQNNGTPIAGAALKVSGPGGLEYTGASQADGWYEIFLPAGVFDLTVTAPGYRSVVQNHVIITDFLTTTLNVSLEPCTTPEGLGIVYAPVQPEAGTPVVFTATTAISGTPPVNFSWQFGDGGSAGGVTTSHTYDSAGEYPVKLTAEACGIQSYTTTVLSVGGTPQLALDPQAISYTLPTGRSGQQTLTITNSGTAPLNWSVSEAPPVAWLESDASAHTLPPLTGADYELSFTAPVISGTYTTTLRVTSDALEGEQTLPVTLQAACQAPENVEFTYQPIPTYVDEPVYFRAPDAGGSLPADYAWTFSGGIQASGSVVTHTFTTSGLKTATLAVTSCGGTEQTSLQIAVLSKAVDWPFAAYLPLISVDSP